MVKIAGMLATARNKAVSLTSHTAVGCSYSVQPPDDLLQTRTFKHMLCVHEDNNIVHETLNASQKEAGES